MSVHINSFASFDVTEYMNTLITVCFVYTLYNYNYIIIYISQHKGWGRRCAAEDGPEPGRVDRS